MKRSYTRLFVLLSLAATTMSNAQSNTLVDQIIRFREDEQSLERKYGNDWNPTSFQVKDKFFRDTRSDLKKIDFEKLTRGAQVDYLLLSNYLDRQDAAAKLRDQQHAETASFMPFSGEIYGLESDLIDLKFVDAEKTAELLNKLRITIDSARTGIDKKKPNLAVATRARRGYQNMERSLQRWFEFYQGYDPMFTWWCEAPYKAVQDALKRNDQFIDQKFIDGNQQVVVGDPIGERALIEELKLEQIPYSPDELITIANREFAWCEAEMLKASQEMGFGKDWKKALEKVKQDHVEPGKQTELIRDYALEAIDFLEKRDLVTIPELCKQTWRMTMMSPEAQLQNPFFLGGEQIIVSFPTNTMEHNAKEMSLRGNNKHFARATVHHELIPGHHLQQFMESRYQTHRQIFGSPFWTEGWALYWEMMLWDKGFAKSPENRVGMLFWRMHRCARIIFSLSFHLNKMSAQECVDFLVERVGHERANAEAEVRRSFAGAYPPLYQIAYMIGALQIKQMRHELVDSKKMTEKTFHDAFLQNNSMPIAFVRAALSNFKLSKSGLSAWKF